MPLQMRLFRLSAACAFAARPVALPLVEQSFAFQYSIYCRRRQRKNPFIKSHIGYAPITILEVISVCGNVFAGIIDDWALFFRSRPMRLGYFAIVIIVQTEPWEPVIRGACSKSCFFHKYSALGCRLYFPASSLIGAWFSRCSRSMSAFYSDVYSFFFFIMPPKAIYNIIC